MVTVAIKRYNCFWECHLESEGISVKIVQIYNPRVKNGFKFIAQGSKMGSSGFSLER